MCASKLALRAAPPPAPAPAPALAPLSTEPDRGLGDAGFGITSDDGTVVHTAPSCDAACPHVRAGRLRGDAASSPDSEPLSPTTMSGSVGSM